jgi:hypothetical protein
LRSCQKFFSKMSSPFYIPSVGQGLQFLHFLANTCYCIYRHSGECEIVSLWSLPFFVFHWY